MDSSDSETARPPMASSVMGRLRQRFPRFSLSFQAAVAGVVVGAMLLLMTVVSWQVHRSAQTAIVAASDENAHRVAAFIHERAKRIVQPADAALHLLRFDPISGAQDLDARLQRLPALTGLLELDPLLAAVYVGYHDGQFFLVRPLRSAAVRDKLQAPPQAAFLVQSRARRADGGLGGRWMFYDQQLQLLQARDLADYVYDPRTRPWFLAGLERKHLTAPYLFFTTQEVGLTLSQADPARQAVFGLDVTLTTLGQEVEGLKLMPRTEIAIVNAEGKVLGHPGMLAQLPQSGSVVQLPELSHFRSPSLELLQQRMELSDRATKFEVAGESWLGLVQPLRALGMDDLRILMAVPSSELLASVDRTLYEQLALSALLILLLLPLGWWAGARVGRSLEGLTRQARELAHFNFQHLARKPSPLKEVRELGEVMDHMSNTIQQFLDISRAISTESQLSQMLPRVLRQLVSATRCSSGAVYLVQGESGALQCVAVHQADDSQTPDYPRELDMAQFHAAEAGDQAAATEAGERWVQLPLHTREGTPLGLLSLRYRPDADSGGEDAHFLFFAAKLSGTLSVAIETRSLIDAQKQLLDGVIRLLADATDAKSPYTGGHCERVPMLAEALMQRMCAVKEGPFAQVQMSEAEQYEFRLGAWLHDCGKLTSPEHVIDKATKLEIVYNRIHEIRMRFEVLWRDAEIACLQACAADPEQAAGAEQTLQQTRAQLQDEFAFVARCNIGGEFLADADIQRLQQIGQRGWWRQFDSRLGLSAMELQRLPADASPPPVHEALLADKEEHILPWDGRKPPVQAGDPGNHWGFDMVLPPHQANYGELYNLSIRRGTLTAEERFKVNDHIVQTIVMLKSLPFPPHLAKVPDIAGSHHEKLDGTGYPRRLTAQELTLADRVMTLADVFEALTAADRPYKPAKPLSESLRIMGDMVKHRHLDGAVFRFFLESGIWRDYARDFLQPQQRDVGDWDEVLRLLPQLAEPQPA